MKKIYREMGTDKIIDIKEEIGTASIIRMSIPYEILDELDIDRNKCSSIFLILTCAHNVVFKESMKSKDFIKVNELFIILGKEK